MAQEHFCSAEKNSLLGKILRKSQKHNIFLTSSIFEPLKYNNLFIYFSNSKTH